MKICSKERLKMARESNHQSLIDVASAIGITFESYRDLEDFEDEIVNCISIQELCGIGKFLNVDVRWFFTDPPFPVSQVHGLKGFANKIIEHIKLNNMNISAFEELVGWEVAECLNVPQSFFYLNLDALMDICCHIGLDWLAVLPAFIEIEELITIGSRLDLR